MYINQYKENLTYVNNNRLNDFINVTLSGITNPHPDYHVIIKNHYWHVFEYVLSGKGHIEYNGNKYTVGAGDFYYYHKEIDIKYYADKDDPYKKLFINISGSIIDNIVNTFMLGDLMIRHIDVADIFYELLALTEQLDIEQDPTILRSISLLIYKLVNTVVDQNTIFGSISHISTAEKIHNYIDNHLTRHITLSEIAESFFLSENHCIRIFREKYGITPMKYLTEARLKRSCELVSNTKLPLQDIAEIFQFCDLHHYSNNFKKYFGISPTQFRLSAKK